MVGVGVEERLRGEAIALLCFFERDGVVGDGAGGMAAVAEAASALSVPPNNDRNAGGVMAVALGSVGGRGGS